MPNTIRRVDAHVHIGSFAVLEDLSSEISSKSDVIGFRSRSPQKFAAQAEQEVIDNTPQLLRALDRYALDAAIVMARPGVPDKKVAEMAGRHPDRLVPQLRIGLQQQLTGYLDDPTEYRAQAPDEISRSVREHGFVGVGEIFIRSLTKAIHPEEIADDLGPLVERCIEEDIPVSFPTGWSQWKGGLYYGDPVWLDELAGRHPDARFVLTKMGRGSVTIFETVMAVAMRNVNVSLDLTHSTSAHLSEAVRVLGASRVMFGTDWSATYQYLTEPNDVHGVTIDMVNGADITDEDKELIMGRNAIRFFKLESRLGGSKP
ncbi:amidohydrolase family protein [Actinophytocola sp.]|uniref:amidohydrolase family protein n=1 Tax=Actinophytocola sp. TaxID=1872138 RepID=UPI003D6AD9E2